MSLRSKITQQVQHITTDVRVNSIRLPRVVSLTCRSAEDEINATANITVAGDVSWVEEGMDVEIWLGYGGEVVRRHRGRVTARRWSAPQQQLVIESRSRTDVVTKPWKGEADGSDTEYTDQDSDAIIRNILEKYGITPADAYIEGSGWTLGTIDPVLLKAGQPGWNLIREIDECERYSTFTDPAGVVRRLPKTRVPGANYAWHFRGDVDILSASRSSSIDNVVNKVIVKGLEYEGIAFEYTAQAANEFIPNPPEYVSEQFESVLIESDERAGLVAVARLEDLNRKQEDYDLVVIGNPLISPGMTVRVTCAAIGISAQQMRVVSCEDNVTIGQYQSRLRVSGGQIASGPITLPPVAVFSVSMFRESNVDSGGSVTDMVVVTLDGTASYDIDSDDALTYAWTITPTGGTITNSSAAGDAVQTFFLDVTDAGSLQLDITLVVTDSDAQTGTSNLVVPIDLSALLVEDKFTSEGTIVAYTDNGERSWRTQTVPGGTEARCHAPIGADWGTIWGCQNGKIYATFDRLVSDLVDLGSPAGAVACNAVWLNESDPTKAWAAFANGTVYVGILDPNTSAMANDWILHSTIPETPVYEIREDYFTTGVLRATAGNTYYVYNGAWNELSSFGVGATATRMAAGFGMNFVGSLADTMPVQNEEGASLTVPSLSPAVDDVRGITTGLRKPELYLADADNRTFVSEDLTNYSTTIDFTRSDDTPAIVNHMIRSGSEEGVVYGAIGSGSDSAGGVIKSIRMQDPRYIRRTTSRKVYMVGYGVARSPSISYVTDIYRGTRGLTSGGVWKRNGQSGTWTKYNSGIGSSVQDQYFFDVKVHPTQTNKILAIICNSGGNVSADGSGNIGIIADTAYSPVIYSSDSGATWSHVPCTSGGVLSQELGYRAGSLTWAYDTTGDWVLVLNPASSSGAVIVRGTDGTHNNSYNVTSNVSSTTIRGFAGTGGDTVIGSKQTLSSSYKQAVISSSNTSALVGSGGSADYAIGTLLKSLGTSSAYGSVDNNKLYYGTSYSGSLATERISSGIVTIGSGSYEGIAIAFGATDIFTVNTSRHLCTAGTEASPASSATEISATSALPLGDIRVDQQTGTVLAGAVNYSFDDSSSYHIVAILWDGTTYSEVVGVAGMAPSGTDYNSYLGRTIEVVRRAI